MPRRKTRRQHHRPNHRRRRMPHVSTPNKPGDQMTTMSSTTGESAGLGRLVAPHAAAPVAPPGSDRVVVGAGHRQGVTGDAERQRLRASLGAALRRARARRRMTQASLALLAGCHLRSVQRLEAGVMRPTTALLEALATALVAPAGVRADRVRVAQVAAALSREAGESLRESTPGGARRRRRRMRDARRAARKAAARAGRSR
ncbi:helix-turn-helix domain-containing protein [Actinoplanes sp. NPDC051494]|uniref:helix-turn-helix domain-containing protein n=1 Tax=Actinoplanes sp. NPDC051494 TaxID=3363907 RepID=UPI0037980560